MISQWVPVSTQAGPGPPPAAWAPGRDEPVLVLPGQDTWLDMESKLKLGVTGPSQFINQPRCTLRNFTLRNFTARVLEIAQGTSRIRALRQLHSGTCQLSVITTTLRRLPLKSSKSLPAAELAGWASVQETTFFSIFHERFGPAASFLVTVTKLSLWQSKAVTVTQWQSCHYVVATEMQCSTCSSSHRCLSARQIAL